MSASKNINPKGVVLGKELKETLDDIHRLSDKEELILFISFDLVNSSSFKTRNYTTWFTILITIIERIKSNIVYRIENCQLWRTLGDEAVFIVNIIGRKQLEDAVQASFEVLNDTIEEIKDGTILGDTVSEEEKSVFIAQNALSLRATSWIAPVRNTSTDYMKDTANMYNLLYMYNYNGDDGLPTYEFQGNDIDIGFRIEKHTRERRLTLSLELACLLSENQLIDPKINIITYRSLRGIWREKIYPIIWYHDENYTKCKLEDSFFYDEYYTDDITKEYIDKEYKNTNFPSKSTAFQKLYKIINDKNMAYKIDYIKEMLGKCQENKKIIRGNRLLEVHCAAICVDFQRKKILMFKRSKRACIDKEKWDFGCCTIQSGLSFKDNLEKDYKKKFNVSIEILDPIKEYSFQNLDKKIIPGIRFLAKIIKIDEKIKIINPDYSEYKYVSFDELKNINEEDKDDYTDYNQFLEIIYSIEKICIEMRG